MTNDSTPATPSTPPAPGSTPPPPAPNVAAAGQPHVAPPTLPYGGPTVPPHGAPPYVASPSQPYGAPTPFDPATPSEKSFIATWLLSWLLGIFGADRFYLGKIGTAIAKLLTLGGLGVWVLVDLIITLTQNATDTQGRKVRGSGKEPMIAWIVTAAVVALGLITNIATAGSAASNLASPRVAVEEVVEAAEPAAAEPQPPVDDRTAVVDVVGRSVAEARTALQAIGFELVTPAGAGDDWTVLSQSVSAGSRADAGTQIRVTVEAPAPVYTLAQQNSVRSAQNYLSFTGFSRTGLISQLEYEGFSTDEATFGVDNAGADWNAEAAEKAADYLEYSSFSRQSLYDQLAYEGFAPGEIEFGLAAVGY